MDGQTSSVPDETLGNLESTKLRDETRSSSRRRTKTRTSINSNPPGEDQPPFTIVEPSYGEDLTTEPETETAGVATRSNVGQPEVLDSADEELPIMVPDEPKPKNKRGRKKKEIKSPGLVEEQAVEPDPLVNEAPPPVSNDANRASKGKRKRGRPRKSDTSKTSDPEVLPVNKLQDSPMVQDTVEGQHHELTATGAVEAQGEPTVRDPSLKEIDHNSRSDLGQDTTRTEMHGEGTSSAKESRPVEQKPRPEVGKVDTGKLHYRVGLSKKSRIAPLLKIVRK